MHYRAHHALRAAVIAFLMTLAVACSTPAPPSPVVPVGALETLHARLGSAGESVQIDPARMLDPQYTSSNIDAIGLERTCHGMCVGTPFYTVIIYRDGTFCYVGRANVPHLGKFTGTVGRYPLRHLLLFVDSMHYFDLPSGYQMPVMNIEESYTFARRGRATKTVWKAGDYSGPTDLWAMEQLIDGLMSHAHWQPGTTQTVAGSDCFPRETD